MSRIFALTALAAVLVTSPAQADEVQDEWPTITESTDFLWQGKRGSGTLTNVDGKKNTGYMFVYQKQNKKRQTYEYGQVFVKLEACRKGYGYLYYNEMDGKYVGKDAFVRFGGTVADNLGYAACRAWDSDTGKVSAEDAANTWELAAKSANSDTKYSIKTDTIRTRLYKGKSVIAALYSEHDGKAGQTTYGEYLFAKADCSRGFGSIYLLDFDGVQTGKHDTALSGDSVASVIATMLCKKAGTGR